LLTEEIAAVRDVSPEVASGVLEEFYQLIETQQYMVHGGLEYATKLLVDTFGKQRANDLLSQVKNAQEAQHSDLAMLQEVDPQQLSKFLEGEHPQTVALVLAHLDPKRASQVLQQLAEGQRVDSIRRLAEMQQFSPEMAQKVALGCTNVCCRWVTRTASPTPDLRVSPTFSIDWTPWPPAQFWNK